MTVEMKELLDAAEYLDQLEPMYSVDHMPVPDAVVAGAKLARHYIATVKNDDDYLLTTDWLKKNAKHCVDEGYWDVPPSGDSWCEIGPISFVFEPYYDDGCESDSLLATDWQIDGDDLPQMLIPKTRGDLRALCRMVKHELQEVTT